MKPVGVSMAVRHFCDIRTRQGEDGTSDRDLADYLAGYAEAIADAQGRRRPGSVPDD